MDQNEPKRLSRRELLRIVGLTAAGIVLSANTPLVDASPQLTLSTGANMFNGLYTAQFEEHLAELSSMNASVIRVLVPNSKLNTTQASEHLGKFLQAAGYHRLKVIPVLIDSHGDNNFHPKAVSKFYSGGNIPILNQRFYDKDYKDAYTDFVGQVVSDNKNSPNIFAWEPGNELRAPKNPQALIDFMTDTCQSIQTIDPAHAIASGIVNTHHVGLTPDKFYGAIPQIGLVTIHDYEDQKVQSSQADINWANSHNRVVIVEETGYLGPGDRSDKFERGIRRWKTAGAKALMIGAFTAKGQADYGNGDHQYGMDDIWHTDYNSLFRLFKSYGSNSLNAS